MHPHIALLELLYYTPHIPHLPFPAAKANSECHPEIRLKSCSSNCVVTRAMNHLGALHKVVGCMTAHVSIQAKPFYFGRLHLSCSTWSNSHGNQPCRVVSMQIQPRHQLCDHVVYKCPVFFHFFKKTHRHSGVFIQSQYNFVSSLVPWQIMSFNSAHLRFYIIVAFHPN